MKYKIHESKHLENFLAENLGDTYIAWPREYSPSRGEWCNPFNNVQDKEIETDKNLKHFDRSLVEQGINPYD